MTNYKKLSEVLDVQNGFITKVKYQGKYDEKYLVYKGDYLIGMDGDFICYQWKGEPSLLNQRVCRLIDFKDNLEPKYVFYGINNFLKKIQDATAFVTVKHITSKKIKEINFPMVDFEKQKTIAKTLDKAKELIELRKTSIEKLDELSKSVFIDMFGDIHLNPNGIDWDKANFWSKEDTFKLMILLWLWIDLGYHQVLKYIKLKILIQKLF